MLPYADPNVTERGAEVQPGWTTPGIAVAAVAVVVGGAGAGAVAAPEPGTQECPRRFP